MPPATAAHRDHRGKGTQMRKGVLLTAVLSMIFSWSSLASAKSFEIGGKLGVSVPAGDFADASDEGVAYGFYGSFLLTTRAALQVSLFMHDHDLNVTEPNKFLANLGEDTLSDFVTMSNGDISMKEVAINGKYAFTEGKIVPYVIAGGGIHVWEVNVDGNQSGLSVSESTGTDPDGRNSDTTVTNEIGDEISRGNSFVDLGLNAGLGVAFKVTGEISLGVEAMYTYIFGDFDEGFTNVTGILSYAF